MATWRMPPIAPKPKLAVPKIDWQSAAGDADVQFSFKGLDALEANLRSMGQWAMDAAGYEMADIARDVIAEAKGPDWDSSLVPILTGALRDSGDHDEYKPNNGQSFAQIAMWFGGEVGPEALEAGIKDTSSYAVVQHEDLTFHHEFGGPKYLEIPFARMTPKVAARIAKRIGETIGGSSSVDVAFQELTSAPKYPGYGSKVTGKGSGLPGGGR